MNKKLLSGLQLRLRFALDEFVRMARVNVGPDLWRPGVFARPTDRQLVDFLRAAKPDRHWQLTLAQVTTGTCHAPLVDFPTRFDGDFRTDGAAVGFLAVAFQRERRSISLVGPEVKS